MRTPLFAAIFCTTATTFAHAATIQESVSAAMNYHPAIISATEDTKAAMHDIDVARGGNLPQVDMSLSSGLQRANNTTIRGYDTDGNSAWVNSAELSLQQKLFDGGNVSNSIVAAEKRLEAAGHLQDERTQDVMLEAARAHIEVMKGSQLVALAERNVKAHEGYVEDIRARAENGVISSTDAYHAEARLALAYTSLSEEEENLLKAQVRYMEVIGQQPQDLSMASVPSASFRNQDEALDFAIANNPTISESYSNSQVADANYKRTSAAFAPQINFEITSSVQDNSATSELSNFNSQSHDTFAGVTLSWNLFNGGSDDARRDAAASTKASTEALLKLAQRDIREEVGTIWQERNKLQDRIPLLESYSSSIQTVLSDYIDQFAVNRRDLLDLLDRQVESYRADSDLITANYDLAVRNYELLHATGQIQDQF